MGHPMRLFHFFWPWCVGWKVVAAISSKKSGTISFFFIIFWQFLPIFPFFGFLAHFAHFMPPYGRPLITCDPISYFCVSWVQLAHGWHCRQKKSMNFGFKKKMTIFSFLAILTPDNPPIGRRTKHWGTSGDHLRVPTPPPDSTKSPKSRHHILFSLGGQFGRLQRQPCSSSQGKIWFFWFLFIKKS